MRRVLTRILAIVLIVVPAVLAGFATSRLLAPDLLRTELETRLSELLEGDVSIEHAALSIQGGVRVEGKGLSVYPQPGKGPALTANSAAAEIDLLQLLLGQFRLESLRIEGAHFQIEHGDDDRWTPHPIALLAEESEDEDTSDVGLLRALEVATRWLLEEPEIARVVELADSKISFVDSHVNGHGRGAPFNLALEGIDGELRHHWLSPEAELSIRARFTSGGTPRGSLEIMGRHRSDGSLRLGIAGTAIELESLAPYAAHLNRHARLSGLLSGVVAFETATPGHGLLELDWISHQLDSVIPIFGRNVLPLQTDRGTLEASLEITPDRYRLSEARLAGSKIRFDISGGAERPLDESSSMRLTAEMKGVDLEEGQRFVEALPEEDRETLQQLLTRIEAGEILEMGGTGVARIAEWQQLFEGRLRELPPGFVLTAELDEVRLATGDEDVLEGVGGRIEWSADRFEVRDGRGRWNQVSLPKLALVVEGASNLFVGDDRARELRGHASELPGLQTLLDVLFTREPDETEAEPLADVPPLRIDFDHLDHPVLRWPLDDGRLDIVTNESGAQLVIEARWAGAPTRAEAIWKSGEDSSVDLHVTVKPPDAGVPMDVLSQEDGWASGRFEIGRSERGRFPFELIHGGFEAHGTRLTLDPIGITLLGSGRITGRANTDLGREDEASVELAFEVAEAPVATLAHFIGLPEGIATGTVSASGAVSGELRSETPLLAGLSGVVDFEATDGNLKMNIPLVVAIAQATEGFNPLAERKEVFYERAEARLELGKHRVSTERLTLEGPMRVFASGEIDLADEGTIDAVVGVFLFRQAATTIGTIPILGALISDKGLLGAYYSVEGRLSKPKVKALPLSSLAEAVPDVIKAPIKMLGFVFRGPSRDESKRKRLPDVPAKPQERP